MDFEVPVRQMKYFQLLHLVHHAIAPSLFGGMFIVHVRSIEYSSDSFRITWLPCTEDFEPA